VSLVTSLNIGQDWTAAVNTQVAPVAAGNRCTISFLQIDVTDRITGFLGPRINQLMAGLSSDVTQRLSLRSRAEDAWKTMLAPAKLMENLWLVIDPQSVAMSPLSVSGNALQLTVRLSALPQVVYGAMPAAPQRPLPNLEPTVPGSEFRVNVPVKLQRDEVNLELNKALHASEGGLRYPPVGSPYLLVTSAELYPYGDRAVLRLNFEGSAKGHAYFIGTPTYNAVTNRLSFPDLEYDIDTKNLFLKLIEWLKHDEFRDDLRGRLVVDLSSKIQPLRQQLEAALNRTAGAVKFAGQVASLRLLGILADQSANAFVLYTEASGNLTITVGVMVIVTIAPCLNLFVQSVVHTMSGSPGLSGWQIPRPFPRNSGSGPGAAAA
jgi:hypothetical protein